jgi:TolB-like protein/Tfp pilus assembly protein PilF
LGAYFYFRPTTPGPPISEKSVAVLPFDNVGGDKQNDYLSDGLTTEVIYQLSKIADLRVISRDSVLGYKAIPGVTRKSLRDIGNELNVGTVLESSIQRLNDQIKIIAVLYDTKNGKRLWGAAYNREMKDLFAIESDVAEQLAAALQVSLTSDERNRIQSKPTENLTAYDLYLRAQAFYELRHVEDNQKAIELFRQALELDPKFALGYVGLGNSYIDRNVRFHEETFWLDSAIDVGQRAIAIEPAQVRAYVMLARAFTAKDLPDQADDAVNKALRLAPNDAEVNFRAASQLSYSDPEAYRLMRKAHSLDPNDPRKPYFLAEICAIIGQDELREKWIRKAIDLESDSDRRQMLEAERLLFRGDYPALLAALQKLPSGLFTYNSSVLELMVGCAERSGDGNEVLRLLQSESRGAGDEMWHLFHTVQGLKLRGDLSGAHENALRLQTMARANFSVNMHNHQAGYYLAFSDVILGQKEEAVRVFRQVFPRIVDDLPLFRADYSMDVLSQEDEIRALLQAFDSKNEESRKRVAAIEKSFE